MPKTFATTVAPVPSDSRVLRLSQLLTVSRSQAVGIVTMAWDWLLGEESEGVVPVPVTILDNVVDHEGAGQALVDAGLVGVVPEGLVLPPVVRQASARSQRDGESADDRRRRQQRERASKSRRRRQRSSPPQASPTPAEAPVASRKSVRLGMVEGRNIMLLFRRDGVPFYKLQGAVPKDFTGTVTDPENPSLADAFVALLSTMRREQQRCGDIMRPTMEQMVAAALHERDQRSAAAAAAARLEQANRALSEAVDADQGDDDQGGPERDAVTVVSRSERDSVTCHAPVTLEGSVTLAVSPCADRDLGAISEGSKCHAPCHTAAPSSSSSLLSLEVEDKETTTTTRGVPPAERDTEDILKGFLPTAASTVKLLPLEPADQAKLERHRRFAAALGTTVEAVTYQLRHEPDLLLTRLRVAGIDPRTGLPVNAGGAGKTATIVATSDTEVTTEPAAAATPVVGVVGASGDDVGFLQTSGALDRLGIVRAPPAAPPGTAGDEESFEDHRRNVMEQLLRAGA